jgi:hypothetical protein
VPLNLTVDYGWSWNQCQKSLEVLGACSWVLPETAKDLMTLPDISDRMAKVAKNGESLIENIYRESADF